MTQESAHEFGVGGCGPAHRIAYPDDAVHSPAAGQENLDLWAFVHTLSLYVDDQRLLNHPITRERMQTQIASLNVPEASSTALEVRCPRTQ